jgi:hypothetical protein
VSEVSNACSALLAGARRFSPQYGPRLTNHLPMALVALDRMGAGAATMQAFAAHYATRLAPFVDEPGAVDPRDYLGAGKHYAQIARHFQGRIDAAGSGAVLREWVPVLLPGLATAAFHAMIRLAYAVDAGIDAEIALALAYWVTAYKPLQASIGIADDSLAGIAATLAAAVEGHVFEPGNIGDRMRQVAGHPALLVAAVQPTRLALRDVARFSIGAYAAREDFTLLHTVTGCHAFRLLLPFAGDEQAALRHLWQAVLVAYLTTVHPDKPPAPAIAPLAMDQIRALACSSLNDHVIKICYSSLREYREYGDDRYLAVASRNVAP